MEIFTSKKFAYVMSKEEHTMIHPLSKKNTDFHMKYVIQYFLWSYINVAVML